MIVPAITGSMHYGDATAVKPFAIGQLDPTRGFTHVFDDTTLNIVMQELDTTPDFVEYLTKKEAFFLSRRQSFAAGEEELLAFYLRHLNKRDEHDFVLPAHVKAASFVEGGWQEFIHNPRRLAKVEADDISYTWDRLIEAFNIHILAGTSYAPANATVKDREKVMRMLAAEGRTARRILAKAILDLLEKSPPSHRATRIVLPPKPGSPHYVLALVPHLPSVPYPEYREVRQKLLGALCKVTKLKFPEAMDIVGLATEPGTSEGRSEDAMYLDARTWTPELQAEAESLQRDLDLLTKLKLTINYTEHEYPEGRPDKRLDYGYRYTKRPRSIRNSLCPCGSGKKFKRCCRSKG